MSIRKPPGVKPLMIFVRDKSVYNHFLLGNWQWVAPGGQRALLPKTEGFLLYLVCIHGKLGLGLGSVKCNWMKSMTDVKIKLTLM